MLTAKRVAPPLATALSSRTPTRWLQHAPTATLDSRSTGSGGLLSQQQQQRMNFSSKRRVRYGSEQSTRAKSKLFSFMKQKQKAQLEKLRASLAKETVAAMALPPVSVVSTDVSSPRIVNGDDSSGSNSSEDGASGAASESDSIGKHAREFSRMRKLKEAKRERVKHLPLFKPNSPLLRHFGDQTLGSYEHLPTTAFDGPVIVLHSPQEEAIYAPYLRAQKATKPDFHSKKQMNPVCLIQLATLERAFIYRLSRGQPLPPVLQAVLADPQVLKVGHSLHDDFRQMKASQLVQAVNATIDTLPIANKLGCLRPGLRTLCQLFLGGAISKDMQVSNWEATRLSPAQVKYAATDAWAPLRVLLAMLQLDETRLLLRTKSYSSIERTVIDDDHDKLLGLLRDFAMSQQQQR